MRVRAATRASQGGDCRGCAGAVENCLCPGGTSSATHSHTAASMAGAAAASRKGVRHSKRLRSQVKKTGDTAAPNEEPAMIKPCARAWKTAGIQFPVTQAHAG